MRGQKHDANVAALRAACDLLSSSKASEATELLQSTYPHTPLVTVSRKATLHQMMDVYTRDGFIDRYSGERLLFPGVLYVLTAEIPLAVPRHPNWKMSETHPAYWDLMPTLDHIVPIARSGTNGRDNLVTTSMRRNMAKSNWTLDELGWEVLPGGNLRDWDGLMEWFADYVGSRPALINHERIRRWEWAHRHWKERVAQLQS